MWLRKKTAYLLACTPRQCQNSQIEICHTFRQTQATLHPPERWFLNTILSPIWIWWEGVEHNVPNYCSSCAHSWSHKHLSTRSLCWWEGREDSLEENTASLGFYLTAPSYFPYAEAREHAMRTVLTGARRKGLCRRVAWSCLHHPSCLTLMPDLCGCSQAPLSPTRHCLSLSSESISPPCAGLETEARCLSFWKASSQDQNQLVLISGSAPLWGCQGRWSSLQALCCNLTLHSVSVSPLKCDFHEFVCTHKAYHHLPQGSGTVLTDKCLPHPNKLRNNDPALSRGKATLKLATVSNGYLFSHLTCEIAAPAHGYKVDICHRP